MGMIRKVVSSWRSSRNAKGLILHRPKPARGVNERSINHLVLHFSKRSTYVSFYTLYIITIIHQNQCERDIHQNRLSVAIVAIDTFIAISHLGNKGIESNDPCYYTKISPVIRYKISIDL